MMIQSISLKMVERKVSRRWRFILFGGVGAGKSTLKAILNDRGPEAARKSQMIDYSGFGIDTPGEYSEMGRMRNILSAAAFDAELLVVVQDGLSRRSVFPPAYFSMYSQLKIGVVTKMDLPDADCERGRRLLQGAGVNGPIFCVSALTGDGISALRDFILKQEPS
jgi:ethanolamine utilization protein EutP